MLLADTYVKKQLYVHLTFFPPFLPSLPAFLSNSLPPFPLPAEQHEAAKLYETFHLIRISIGGLTKLKQDFVVLGGFLSF